MKTNKRIVAELADVKALLCVVLAFIVNNAGHEVWSILFGALARSISVPRSTTACRPGSKNQKMRCDR